ncbi:hypothetical protein RUM44_003475 [Polyplax serrata]|uniref:PDZ domain-containing protein n=1 Tax=Polyplax serrata TaxID=468196 RepID=A0ABR1AGJ9_POLSC
MFSSLKLNPLKCQSNSRTDSKKEKCSENDSDDVSEHMYEKLPSFDGRSYQVKASSKPGKIPFSKRISKWKMECPGITHLRNSRPDEDNDDQYYQQREFQHESKNNQDGKLRGIPNLEHACRTKVMTVNIEREDGNLGITLRGGFHQNSELSRPVVITYVKPDSPAARLGTIKPGDRLLAVDGVSLQGGTLHDAQKLLKQPSATILLTIEYNVNILDGVEHGTGPLLVEIEKSSMQQLGLTLFQSEGGVIIERVKPGSLADRSGALHIGDEILAVNSTRINAASTSLEDVLKVLEYEYPIVRLEILPSNTAMCYSKCDTWRARDTLGSFSHSVNTIKDNRSYKQKNFKVDEPDKVSDYKVNHLKPYGICGAEVALTHTETLHTTLTRENGTFGLQFIDSPDGRVLINSMTPDGPAERSQCLHPGDRVLSINHRSLGLDNLTAKDINDLLEFKPNDSSCSKLNLHTEFDVLDTVVPSSGIFLVKLIKRGSAGLGITMTASKRNGFIVCEMKKGSIAHRAGSLVPGDKLLAINNVPLDQCSVEYASHIFQQSSNIVTLKVQREEGSSDLAKCGRKITYAVDLQRFGGPLGITIAGSEEPTHPITISGLTAGGLAEQTGVIHIGDEILAINNHSLAGEPLSRAHVLLQNSPDLVTLKLSRSLVPIHRLQTNRSPVLPSSIDSAVESWDSSRMDLAPSPDYQKPASDSHDSEKRKQTPSQQWQLSDTHAENKSDNPDVMSLAKNTAQENSNLAILDEITSENLKIKHELDLLSIKLDEQRKSKLAQDEQNALNSSTPSNAMPFSKENSVELKNMSASKREPEEPPIDINEIEEEIYQGRKIDNLSNELNRSCKERESMMTTDFEKFEMAFLPETRNWCKNQYFGSEDIQGSIRSEFQSSQLYEVTLYKDPIYEDFGFSVSDGLYERGVFINRIRKGGPADLSNVLRPYDRIIQVNKTYTQDFDCCLTVPLIASAGDCLVLLVARNPGHERTPQDDDFDYEKFTNQVMTMSTSVLGPTNHEEFHRILV